MTEDKPIDNCEFFDICVTSCDGTLENTEMCSCYELYKQLACKTRECEELKKERDFYSAEYTRVSTQLILQDAYILIDGKEVWSSDNRKLKQQLNQLKSKNEKLKASTETWKTLDVTFDNGSIKTQISDMSLAEYSDIKSERDKAEQKLEKIREYCNKYPQNSINFKKNILKIIDEVE